jgi:hypothetical protein
MGERVHAEVLHGIVKSMCIATRLSVANEFRMKLLDFLPPPSSVLHKRESEKRGK